MPNFSDGDKAYFTEKLTKDYLSARGLTNNSELYLRKRLDELTKQIDSLSVQLADARNLWHQINRKLKRNAK